MPVLKARWLAEWTGGQWQHGEPGQILGISTDSRTLMPGELFVAIPGPRFDGHAFIRPALARGAAGAMVARTCPCREVADAPLLVVNDTIKALQAMAAAYRHQMAAAIIAVTGSVGKTTVKDLVADVLAQDQPTARTRGNWNNDLGLPLSLLRMEAGARVGVFEVGMNHPGELASLCRMLAPDWGLITTIGPVHLEFFESEEAIAREKAELLKSLPAGGTAVLRADEPWYALLQAAAPGRVISLALNGRADYQCLDPCDPRGRTRVRETASGEEFSFRLPLPGRHQAANALFAVAVGRAFGLSWEKIGRALENFQASPMRWECRTVRGIQAVNDAYNANPVSMAAALQTFAQLPVAGRRWLVLAGMLELGRAEQPAHAALGRRVAAGAWAGLITVGDLGGLIAEAALGAGMPPDRVWRCADHAAAAEVLRRQAAPGDAVLFKASRGMRLEQVLALWTQTPE